MQKKPIFIAYAICVVFIISIFSGCILEDLIFGTSFTLESWEIIDYEGFPAINLSFTASNNIYIKTYDIYGDLIDEDIVFLDRNTTFLNLAHYKEFLYSGPYNLKVFDTNEKVIFEKSFIFEGPKLSLLTFNQYWWQPDIWKEDYVLLAITFDVINNGDTPAYPFSIGFPEIANAKDGNVIPTVILPGEIKKISCYTYQEDIDYSTQPIKITVKDDSGKILFNYSFIGNHENIVSSRQFQWIFNGRQYRLSIPYIDLLYDYYSKLERTPVEDYTLYVFDTLDEDFTNLLVERIMYGKSFDEDVEKINFAVSFVQNLDYVSDDEKGEKLEYPRYPIETLYEGNSGGGDCEDKAILTASILHNLGYDVALLRLTNHMAVGVNIEKNLSAYERYVDNYYFLETTTKYQQLGYIPTEYKNDKNLTVFPLNLRPLIYHHWDNGTISIFKNTFLGDFVKVKIYVKNFGIAAAENVTITAGFFSESGTLFNAKSKIINILEPQKTEKIMLISTIPDDVITVFKTILIINGEIVDEQKSSSIFTKE
ncbi:MAG: hypothetical protein JXA91_01120 [Candidatus Thermoplasmatota archaeon]|nr:hypothetical protein [Candidatus Thermoplasmatota archaeon]